MKTRLKVGAFVMRKQNDGPAELLLFTHVDFPDAPIQIPGSGIEAGEEPYAAALRELHEEAGLDSLPLLRALGVSEWIAPPRPGLPDLALLRHCYLFDGAGLPDHWVHTVTGGDKDQALRFDYRWHRIAPGFTLVGDLGQFLNPASIPELYASATIRRATPDDAPAIARIHVETWRHAYRDIIPASHLDALSIERRTAGWEQNLRKTPDATLVAETAGVIVGWVSFGPCRDEGESAEAELYAIYLDASHQRIGLGRALMAEAERQLVARLPNATRISLWVLARNTPTRRFYERLGYAPGLREKNELIGGESFVELRYEKIIPNSFLA